MKGDAKVIQQLNKVLTLKLTAINQYFLHARMFRDWGFESLNNVVYKASIEEMKHADVLIERLLFLEGMPNLQELGKLYIGEDPREMLEMDHKVQFNDINAIRDAVKVCESHQDYVSRDALNKILDKQEEHLDWLETQIDLMSRLGTEVYLQSMLKEED
ncbi:MULTISPECIES: bacterioferritin [Idiomarina]|jgi:bacterioferritin|uniref:Bacterioferritin n=1 Tax=Idiomarina baltica OS145 TaxID=314276 RepID=A0ABM9WJL2_9GAMM|nr:MULTISPECIES: bacterioferritin [Idiomarina]MAD54776.1 bacterioferritin [Idiomarinaceae bacterium]MEC7644088.1 bacterioferritin [Pseudomonadota bacterium]EAQ31060.1 Bacterioferritin (cytochrome b1) [Idiomarina baltica OS145]KXS35878.1 MAG: Bacterioferritin [Idiomarina sp. T82-3]MAF74484.1 bacterioferritin [Idiomarinaceae bacterium]|tara:strand:+ start:535 stop:1011 length:477 start_codon:yes stop_codon:yes gene_type:complete